MTNEELICRKGLEVKEQGVKVLKLMLENVGNARIMASLAKLKQVYGSYTRLSNKIGLIADIDLD